MYFCCDERRRNAVRGQSTLNGIDFLEVSDNPSDPVELRQRTLFVHFINPLAPGVLTERNVRIEGGERIRDIAVTRVTGGAVTSPLTSPFGSPPLGDATILAVEVSAAGDFSTYTLRLVQDPKSSAPPPGFDPLLSAVAFSFKVNCPSDFDCKPVRVCPEELPKQPEISYLAKDFASFRQLMLDRMAVLTPQWKERNPADLGVALVELLAYVGDQLSYQQDAVATESYLDTARRRASARRHARLIDYPMHDGRNARVWVHIQVSPAGNGLTLKKGGTGNGTKLLTRVEGLSSMPVIPQASEQFAKARAEQAQVFEPMHDLVLYEDHNELAFYTWGERECCLPAGATRATLDGRFPNLKAGDVLILLEKRGPQTGELQDADASHRHAVRLTKVTAAVDPLTTPSSGTPRPVTEIEWGREDRLPFPLCVSSRVQTTLYGDVGVALGNIVLADHGETMTDEPADPSVGSAQIASSLVPAVVPLPNPALAEVAPLAADRCNAPGPESTPPRYRPRLKNAPITQAPTYDPALPPRSARATTRLGFDDPAQFPLPVISLVEIDSTAPITSTPLPPWNPVRDLLESGPTKREFVVEVETDGTAYLRFGDGASGLRPQSGALFLATYRLGNGTSGNVGPGAITHVVSSDPIFLDSSYPKILGVGNPLAASGGVDAETIEHARQNAPSAFRRQERAVLPADYEELVVRDDVLRRCDLDVQRGAATLRWTGSWYTVFLTVDRFNGQDVDDDFERKLRRCLEGYRMVVQDLEVDGPRYVSLELEVIVCVKPNYFFTDVEKALLEAFSDRLLPDGRRGLFHPDNFSFGQPVYLSSIYAAAQRVAGVDSLIVTKFQRQGVDTDEAIRSGRLELNRLEIARLANDPNFPERGALTLRRG